MKFFFSSCHIDSIRNKHTYVDLKKLEKPCKYTQKIPTYVIRVWSPGSWNILQYHVHMNGLLEN